MYIEFSCGKCEVSMSMDSSDDNAVWMLVNRFTDGHEQCGFVGPRKPEVEALYQEVKQKVVQPGKFSEDD